MAPCSIQGGGSSVLWCLCQHRLDFRLYLKHTLGEHWGGTLVVQLPWGLGSPESERTQRDWESADGKSRQLSEFWDKLWKKKIKASQCYSNRRPDWVFTERPGQRKLLLYWLLNYTWLLILIACCIYFYEVLLKKKQQQKTDFLGSERERSERKDLLVSINQAWGRKKKYLKSLNWSP